MRQGAKSLVSPVFPSEQQLEARTRSTSLPLIESKRIRLSAFADCARDGEGRVRRRAKGGNTHSRRNTNVGIAVMAKRRATAELPSVSTLRNVMEGYLLLSCSYTGAMALQGLWEWDRGEGRVSQAGGLLGRRARTLCTHPHQVAQKSTTVIPCLATSWSNSERRGRWGEGQARSSRLTVSTGAALSLPQAKLSTGRGTHELRLTLRGSLSCTEGGELKREGK